MLWSAGGCHLEIKKKNITNENGPKFKAVQKLRPVLAFVTKQKY